MASSLPKNVFFCKHGAFLTDPFIACYRFTGAAHTSAKAAAHSFLKAELTARFTRLIDRFKHRLGTAGIEIGVIHFFQSVGYKTFDTI